MGHDYRADETGRDAPARRVGVLHRAVLVLELDVEGLREVLSEEVARPGLESLLVAHHRLAGICVVSAGEALALGLLAFEDGEREVLGHDAAVDLEHFQRLFDGLFFRRVGGVALLPEEFGGAQEEARALLPAHDVGPLVDEDGQVAPRLHPFAVHVADDGLGGRAHDERLFELFAAGVRDDGALGREALDVLRLLREEGLRYQQREGGVDVARLLEGVVEVALYHFPYRVARRAHDHAAADGRVVRHLGDADDVKVPLRIIFLSRRNVLCHSFILR